MNKKIKVAVMVAVVLEGGGFKANKILIEVKCVAFVKAQRWFTN